MVDIPNNDKHDSEVLGTVRTMVTHALEQVVANGATGQTWRVFVHKIKN